MNKHISNTRRVARGRHVKQLGVSLVEMMVGLVIGLFLVAVMSSIYLGAKNTFTGQEALSRLQEGTRYAVDSMSQDLRMSGFRTCSGLKNTLTQTRNLLVTPTATSNDFAHSLSVSRHSAGAWSPSLDSAVTALSPETASDVVTIYRPFGNSWALTADMATESSALTVSSTSNIAQGDILIVGDCAGSTVFQATNANPGTSGSIAHVTASGSPGNSSANLGQIYLQDASVYRMQAVTYYIGASAIMSGQNALWVRRFPSYGMASPTELVTGVERMSMTLGIDTNGDIVADQFVAPADVTDWNSVVSARAELLLASTDGATTTSPQPYKFAGVTTTPTDQRLRTVVSVVSSLRNVLP